MAAVREAERVEPAVVREQVTERAFALEVAAEHLESDAPVVGHVAVHVRRRVEEQRLHDEREQEREHDQDDRGDAFAAGLGGIGGGGALTLVGVGSLSYQGVSL